MIRNLAGQIIPVYLEDSAGNPVTGAAPTGAELRITKSGDTLVNGAGTWFEVGSGYYLYRPPADETDTEGYLAVLVAASGAVVYPFVRFIDGALTTTSEARARRVPIYLSLGGVGVEGITINDGNTEIAVTVFNAVENVGGESGGGLYYYELEVGELIPSPMVIKVDDAAADTYVYWFEVSQGVIDEDALPEPVESPIDAAAPAYIDHVEAALARLAEQYKERISAT